MITKYQAGITIGFTLAALLGSQMIGNRLSAATPGLFADTAPELGSQQSAVSDRPESRLNSDGSMYGVTLGGTRVYDAQGLQEPKSVLWKTPKLYTQLDSTPLSSITAPYRGALSIVTVNKEALFSCRIADGSLLFVIDLQTGETKKTFKWQNGSFSTPVVAGDLLYIWMGDRSFRAFDRRDWKEKWQIGETGHRVYSGYPTVAYGMVYLGGAAYSYQKEKVPSGGDLPPGSVTAFDALTGKQVWMFTIKGIPTPIA